MLIKFNRGSFKVHTGILSLSFFASALVDRNGIVLRRSQASGGYRSVKAVQKKAPGRGPAA